MPKIPQLQADKVIRSPKMSPGAAAAPYVALARAGQQVSQTANYTMRVLGAIEEAERRVKATEIGHQIDDDLKDAAESFRMRTDFENFDKDADQFTKDIRAKYDASVGDDQKLQEAVDSAYENKSSDFIRAIQAKKAQEIANRGKGVLEKSVNQSLHDYARAHDENERTLVRDKIVAMTQAFAESRIITFKEAENTIQDFTDIAEEVRADYMIQIAPEAFLLKVKAGDYDLSPKSKQAKIEKAKAKIKEMETAERVRQNQMQKEQKEAEKKVHDEEEQTIGDLFVVEKYSEALNIVSKSMLLTGDEKKTWKIAIEKASQGEKPTVDYTMYRNLSLRASQGIITEAEDLYDLVGKGLTIANVKDIQKIMKDVADPEKKHETELTKLAISSGKKRILKPDPLTLFAFQADSEKQAFLFEHALRAELEKEKDYATRMKMLTPGTKEYIIDDLVNTYDLDMMGTSKPDKERKPLSFYSE